MISAVGWNTRVGTLKVPDVMERRRLRLIGPTGWHSAAASALEQAFKKQRSRARSGQLQCRVGRHHGLAFQQAIPGRDQIDDVHKRPPSDCAHLA
jgi:hypothetical protein